MKGLLISTEFMLKVIISTLIIIVVSILLSTILPKGLTEVCATKQVERINDLFTQAVTTHSTSIVTFIVDDCIEFVSFQPNICGDSKYCYEILKVGQTNGNCEESNVRGLEYKDDNTNEYNHINSAIFCKDKLGTFYEAQDNIFKISTQEFKVEINPLPTEINPLTTKLPKGKYFVEISPNLITFTDYINS